MARAVSRPWSTRAGASTRGRAPALAIVLALAALVACGGGESVQPRELSMARLGVSWAPTELRQTYALRTDSQWLVAWQAHEPRTVPAAARPAVDFTRNMVLGVSQGSGPNGCHGLTIRRVVEHAAEVQVQFAIATPASGALCTQAVVALTDFVVVERSDKPVSFLQAGS